MSSYRIASRYAKSLISLSSEKGQLEAVAADMRLLNASFEGSSELRSFLKSPLIAADKKQTILKKIFSGKLNGITEKFLELMTNKGRESFLNEITQAFNQQYNEQKNITPVKISAAVKLDRAVVDALINDLKAKGQVKDIQLEEVVDPSLIGGFVLQYGDKQIDSSVRSSLQKLKNLVDDDSYIKKIR
ncbi:MAG: ATP synthase F1 subunit delta [Chitinophagales bacterium]